MSKRMLLVTLLAMLMAPIASGVDRTVLLETNNNTG